MKKLKKRYSHFVFDLLFLSNVASPQPILSVHAARLLMLPLYPSQQGEEINTSYDDSNLHPRNFELDF